MPALKSARICDRKRQPGTWKNRQWKERDGLSRLQSAAEERGKGMEGEEEMDMTDQREQGAQIPVKRINRELRCIRIQFR